MLRQPTIHVPNSPSLMRMGALAPLLAAAAVVASCGSDGTGPQVDPPVIVTEALDAAVVQEAYSESIVVEQGDGEYFWEIVGGALPPGLSGNVDDLTLDEFLITGTPNRPGSYSFTIAVEDGLGRADTAALDIHVAQPPEPLAFGTLRLPPALAGHTYQVIVGTTGGDGGDVTFSVVDGALPAGLSLGSDGQFQGQPTTPDTATFTLEASDGNETATRQFRLVVVPENTGRFDITPFPVVPVPAELEDNVAEAIRRWEEALVGNLEPITIPTGSQGFGPDGCFGFGEMANGTSIDDILILINIDSIDGPGEILGQAAPCAVRILPDGLAGDSLPFIGVLTLDEEDLVFLTSEETITDIIQHEIAHILGFGTLWTFGHFDLLVGEGGTDPRYVGEQAVEEYQQARSATDSIPVEDEGGEGTRDSHWRESVFDDELMSGFSESVGMDMPLSRMSIASFADLGYQVDLAAADSDALLSLADGGWRDLGYDVVPTAPIRVLRDGRIQMPEPN